MSNSLDPDQARHFVGPDLDPNCLQSFSSMQALASKAIHFLLCLSDFVFCCCFFVFFFGGGGGGGGVFVWGFFEEGDFDWTFLYLFLATVDLPFLLWWEAEHSISVRLV